MPPEFKIEKGVPLAAIKRRAYASKYPFKDMDVGDSFFLPVAGEDVQRQANNLCNAGHNHAKRHGGKFKTRIVAGGVRIWRVK